MDEVTKSEQLGDWIVMGLVVVKYPKGMQSKVNSYDKTRKLYRYSTNLSVIASIR